MEKDFVNVENGSGVYKYMRIYLYSALISECFEVRDLGLLDYRSYFVCGISGCAVLPKVATRKPRPKTPDRDIRGRACWGRHT